MTASWMPRRVRRALVVVSRPLQTRLHDYLVERASLASDSYEHHAAATWAKRAVRIRSTDPDAWMALGRAAASLGDWDTCLAATNEVLRREDSNSHARALRLSCLLNSNRVESAVADWSSFQEDDVGATAVNDLVLAARLFLEGGYVDEAAAIASIVRLDGAAPIEVEALLRLGRLAELIDVMPQVEPELSQRLRAKVWLTANVAWNRPGRAAWWLDQIDEEREEVEWLLELCEILIGQGHTRIALDCLDRCLNLVSTNTPTGKGVEFLATGTRSALAIGAASTARRFGKALIEDFPDHPWSWLWFGRALRAEGNLVEARDAVEQAISRQYELLPAWEELTLILSESKTTGEVALAANRQLMRLSQDNPQRALSAITNLVALGDSEYARRAVERLALDYPDDRFVLVARHQILRDLGESGSATAALDEIERRADTPGRVAAFRVRLDQESYDEAAERFLDLPPNAARISEVRKLASGLRHEGELSRALDVLEHARSHEDSARVESMRRSHELELDALKGKSEPLRRRGSYSPIKGRILHMVGKSVPHFSSGYTIRTKYLVEAQRRAGVDAWVLSQPGFPWSVGVTEAPIEETVDGVTYLRCPTSDVSVDANIDRMADIVRRLRPAALHAASDFRNAVTALALGRALGIPVIYEVRGVWEETWASKRGDDARQREHYLLRKQRETECVLAVDRVVTLSETLKNEMMQRGVPDGHITVVPNAVDADRFPVQKREEALAARRGISPEEVTVGYISSLVAYEGIEYLIEAVADLRRQGRPVRAIVVGNGEEREHLEQRAAELGADVIFTGHVPHDEILDYYGLIDVFVIPRTADRVCQLVTPLKPYEAMATGRALVVAGVDALREIVEDGVTGLVFEPENSADLAMKLDLLISEPSLRAELGANASVEVRRTHTWSENAEKYIELYREMDVL